MAKQAFLIMAHNNLDQLKILLKTIDHKDVDIFIHIDSKWKDFKKTDLENVCIYSNIFFAERTNVSWGGYSQINCELKLLKLATSKQKYKYYHLLSGVDALIKSVDDIIKFFNEQEKEFVAFDDNYLPHTLFRFKVYHNFQEKIGRTGGIKKILNKLFIKTQQLIGINRIRKSDLKFGFGSNWFSITDDLANYVIENEELIKKTFDKTCCCDEVFLQTLVYSSKFRENVYNNGSIAGNLRLIDWKRGNPYTFAETDMEEIIESPMLFVRKTTPELAKNLAIKNGVDV